MTDKLIGRGFDLLGTIHAIEHASIGILPLIALCDRNDIGGVSHPSHPDTDGRAAIFIYDGHAGGVGIARAAYDHIEELLDATLRTIEDCAATTAAPDAFSRQSAATTTSRWTRPAPHSCCGSYFTQNPLALSSRRRIERRRALTRRRPSDRLARWGRVAEWQTQGT